MNTPEPVRLKVAFGATALLSQLTGLGQYALHLAQGLQRQPGIAPSFFYGTHFSDQVEVAASKATTGVRALARRFLPNAYALDRAARQHFFNAGARRGQYDLYHEPNYLALRFDGPTVITAHDLSWIRHPETHPAERVRAMNKYFEPALRRAALVITDAEFVRQELIQEFGLRPDAVRAIHLGVDPAFRPMDPGETRVALSRLRLSHGGYFLSVGTLEPRKNVEATVAAYRALPSPVRARCPLVMVGMRGWQSSKMEQAIAPLMASGQVRVLGYVERDELAAITAGALALVYPSIYEGFGLPPLEAMACGVPAITSNASSLPEVVGDTGIMVDPKDVEGLSAALQRMAEDCDLRSQLSAKARARAGTFTWQRCAAGTAAAYRLAVSNSR